MFYVLAALAVLIAALMGTLYAVVGKKLLVRYNALSLTVYALLLGSLGLIPLLHPIINNSFLKQITNLSTTGWFAVIFLGVFSTVVGYVIWYVALEIKTASELSVYLYAIPVIATLTSYFVFGDEITLLFMLGGTLVIVGLIIVNMKNKKQQQKN